MTYYKIEKTDAAAVAPGTLVVQSFTDGKFQVEGVLVPVVPCEHGNIDGHDSRDVVTNRFEYWCPGAAVGEETP